MLLSLSTQRNTKWDHVKRWNSGDGVARVRVQHAAVHAVLRNQCGMKPENDLTAVEPDDPNDWLMDFSLSGILLSFPNEGGVTRSALHFPEWRVTKARGLNDDNTNRHCGNSPHTLHAQKHINCAAPLRSPRGQRYWRPPGCATQDSDTSKHPLVLPLHCVFLSHANIRGNNPEGPTDWQKKENYNWS